MMAVSVISSILILGAAVVVLLRIMSNSGISFGKNKLFDCILADKGINDSFNVSAKETFNVFLFALLFRICIFLISVCAIGMFDESGFSFQSILNGYSHWDAKNYMRIAEGGYTYYTENGDYTTLVFFPLYPWLLRLFTLIFKNAVISGIILSSLLYSGACCYLYKLLSFDFSKEQARRTLIYISLFPHAFFFGMVMNESMLLFTMSATLYYIRKHDWMKAGIFGAFASLSRLAGIFLAIPAAVEWLEHYKIVEKIKQKKISEVCKLFVTKGLWIFLMLAGTAVYLFCNYKTSGDWFKFLEYEKKYWYQENAYFGNGIRVIFEQLKGVPDENTFAIWIPEAVTVIFIISLILYGLRSSRSMYISFLIVYFIVNTGITWPLSLGRYMTCAVPAFMILSDFSQRHKAAGQMITAVMASAMGILLTAHICGMQVL